MSPDMHIRYFGRPELPDLFEEEKKEEEQPATVHIEDEPSPTKKHTPQPVQIQATEQQSKQYSRRQEPATSASGSKSHRLITVDLDDSEENILQDPTVRKTKKRSAFQVLRSFDEARVLIPEGVCLEPIDAFDWATQTTLSGSTNSSSLNAVDMQTGSEPAKEDTSVAMEVAPAATHAEHTVNNSIVAAFGSSTAGSSLSTTPTELSKDPLILANFLRSLSQNILNESNHPAFRNSATFLQLTTDDIDTRISLSELEQSYAKQKAAYKQTTTEYDLLKKTLQEEQTKHASEIAVLNAEKESIKTLLQSHTHKINLLKDAESNLKEENKRLTEEKNKLMEEISTLKKHGHDKLSQLEELNKKLKAKCTTAIAAAKQANDNARAEAKAEANKNLDAKLNKYYSICVEDIEKKIKKFMPNFDWDGFVARFMAQPTKDISDAEDTGNPSA